MDPFVHEHSKHCKKKMGIYGNLLHLGMKIENHLIRFTTYRQNMRL